MIAKLLAPLLLPSISKYDTLPPTNLEAQQRPYKDSFVNRALYQLPCLFGEGRREVTPRYVEEARSQAVTSAAAEGQDMMSVQCWSLMKAY